MSSGKMYNNYECNLNPWAWGSNPKLGIKGDMLGAGCHSSTIERLYAWEKKLSQEVKVHSLLVNLLSLDSKFESLSITCSALNQEVNVLFFVPCK